MRPSAHKFLSQKLETLFQKDEKVTDVIVDIEEAEPEPVPPKLKKKDILKGVDFSKVDEHARKVYHSPDFIQRLPNVFKTSLTFVPRVPNVFQTSMTFVQRLPNVYETPMTFVQRLPIVG